MIRLLLPLLVLFAALALGCSPEPQAPPSVAHTVVDQARDATQPRELNLTNQTLIYECPKCGTDYDKPGACPKDQAQLVPTQVAYICPADNQPVDQAGKCPRCAMDARIQKTALGQ